MVKTKVTTTINLPPEIKKKAKKYMVDIGLNLGSWVSDRISKEMNDYYKVNKDFLKNSGKFSEVKKNE